MPGYFQRFARDKGRMMMMSVEAAAAAAAASQQDGDDQHMMDCEDNTSRWETTLWPLSWVCLS